MRSRDETPTHLKEEGFSMRDAGLTVAEAVAAMGVTATLVEQVGPAGLVALPPLLWLFWRSLRREPEVREDVPWLTEIPETQWLEEANASWLRGADISTLAVRYGVEPGWLEAELVRMRQVALDDRPGVDARRQRAEGVAPVAGQP
jgi:hypothetical protein